MNPRRPAATGTIRRSAAPTVPPPTGPRRREDDFDVLKMAPARYDHIDRSTATCAGSFAIGMAVGFWFRS